MAPKKMAKDGKVVGFAGFSLLCTLQGLSSALAVGWPPVQRRVQNYRYCARDNAKIRLTISLVTCELE